MLTTPAAERIGAWRSGDHPGRRQFVTLFTQAPLVLESGQAFGPLTMAFETWGRLNSKRTNAILLLHGFSGDSHACGPEGPGHPTPGWWDGLIGPGLPIDTSRFFVVCPNAFGGCHGSTGPSSRAPDGRPYGSRFPAITIRDMVAAEHALAEQLGIERWAAVIGGSMGGMRALEWAITWPERVERLLVLATCAAATAEVIATHTTQIRAIELDSEFNGGDYYSSTGRGPLKGLCLARSIARLSYGTESELNLQFDRLPANEHDPLQGGRYAVEAYLDEHSEISAKYLDANSYITLTRAMSHHDVGRGRGGVRKALSTISARTTVVSVGTDRLFPSRLQVEIVHAIGPHVQFSGIDSQHGHDGFLVEHRELSRILKEVLKP